MNRSDSEEHLKQLCGWQIRSSRLVKTYQFEDPTSALAFVMQIGHTADEQDHHPHIHWFERNVDIELWTHKSDGLTLRDFEIASCIDRIAESQFVETGFIEVEVDL